jgi:hypothetical protein
MLTPRWRFEPLDVAAILFSVAVFAAAVAVFQFIFGQDPEKPIRDQQMAILSTLAATPPASVEFSLHGSTLTITDHADISEFFVLLVEPAVVPRHHSHPEDEIGFQTEGSTTSYILGRDSQSDDEYWLQLNEGTYPIRTIKLLHSEALTMWLIRKGLIEE